MRPLLRPCRECQKWLEKRFKKLFVIVMIIGIIVLIDFENEPRNAFRGLDKSRPVPVEFMTEVVHEFRAVVEPQPTQCPPHGGKRDALQGYRANFHGLLVVVRCRGNTSEIIQRRATVVYACFVHCLTDKLPALDAGLVGVRFAGYPVG